jgi:hypothetical protein
MSFASPYVDKFLKGMSTSGTALYNQMIGTVRDMQTDEDNRLLPGAYNTSAINDTAGIMIDFFDSPTYEARLKDLIDSLPGISTQVVLASQKKHGDLPSELIDQLIKIQDSYQYALEGVLDDQQVEYALVTPYVNDAFYMVGNNSDLYTLENRTKEIQDAFYHYYITKVTTLVEQFEREQLNAIAEYYQTTKFKFTGPKDKLNRDWCHDKVNKVYTRTEVESWASETWDGQIPGTTPENIWVNLGGYNCRHVLTPVT